MEEDIDCCKYCRFYREQECHKHPPKGYWDSNGKLNCPIFVGAWPTVNETDWCGYFDGNREWDRLRRERHPEIGYPGEIISGDEFRRRELEMIRKYKETL